MSDVPNPGPSPLQVTPESHEFQFLVDLLSLWYVRGLLRKLQSKHLSLLWREVRVDWFSYTFILQGSPDDVAAARNEVETWYMNCPI